MPDPLSVADTAAIVADESRAAMLLALLDGRAYTAKEMAFAANITPQTASFHLEKIFKAGLVDVISRGRYRYFRLKDQHVAQSLEAILSLQTAAQRTIPVTCPPHLRAARVCYDHAAGLLGTRLYRGLVEKGWVSERDGESVATDGCLPFLRDLEVVPGDFDAQARPCLDWSERRFHFAGGLGRALLQGMLRQRWALRGEGRLLVVTEKGNYSLNRWGL